ncbi:MAG: DUF4976 domain-containing protein, partial [Pirellulales bacterium]|nr:DUF4976 domain-containing protein [Pirellulales bacterium]
PPAGGEVDGVSLTPLLRQNGAIAERALFWHYPHYQHYQKGGTTPYGAIRRGDFKLIEFYADSRIELYDLAADPGEEHDLAEPEAERAAPLRRELQAWLKGVDAQMPTVNPRFDPAKPEDTRGGDSRPARTSPAARSGR